MFSILKTLQFVNPAGDLVNMNQNLKQDVEFDVFYIMDFQKDYGLKMKIGRFFQGNFKVVNSCICLKKLWSGLQILIR